MFKVGDPVVVQGLPGVVMIVWTVGATTTYLVELQTSPVRWVNTSQLSQPPQGLPLEPCIVGSVAGTILQSRQTGPYPLYLVLLDNRQDGWFLPAQINPPVPPPPAGPATTVQPRFSAGG